MRVFSARTGRLGRGMLPGDGGRSAGHAGRAQGAKGEKLDFMHRPALCVSLLVSNQVLVLDMHDEEGQVELDQPSSTLQTRRVRMGERR